MLSGVSARAGEGNRTLVTSLGSIPSTQLSPIMAGKASIDKFGIPGLGIPMKYKIVLDILGFMDLLTRPLHSGQIPLASHADDSCEISLLSDAA